MRSNAFVSVLTYAAVFFFHPPYVWSAEAPKAELVEVRKIWDEGPHNAFTDLTRFKGQWYCVFREGEGHAKGEGSIRVIRSDDGEKWMSAARISFPGADLRDAKLSETPDGRLMLNTMAWTPKAEKKRQSLVYFSADGNVWGKPAEIGEPDIWIWRAAWHKGQAYAVGYMTTVEPRYARLYVSPDGIHYKTLVEKMADAGHPGEAGLTFGPDDTFYCLLRFDPGQGRIGQAKPPYKDWTWKDLGQRIGGPALLRLDDGRFVAGVRLYDKKTRTALCWLDPDAGKLTEFLALPSGGDTSYPGLVIHDGLLWVSYYSSHEGKTSIYLAKVKLPE